MLKELSLFTLLLSYAAVHWKVYYAITGLPFGGGTRNSVKLGFDNNEYILILKTTQEVITNLKLLPRNWK